jgi:hypothetical protein
MELRHRGRRVIVERYGPANVLLKHDTLPDWSTSVKTVFNLLKPFRYRKETIDGGEGGAKVRLKGRRKSVRDLIVRGVLWLIRRQPPDALDARIWRNEESNRIYVVMVEAEPRNVESLADGAEESIAAREGEAIPERDGSVRG